MPTALIILDDYLASNRLVGLKCLDRIVRSISKSEFDSYCSDDSIYRMLHPMIYNFESSTVEPVISCICAVLEKRLDNVAKMKWTQYDDIMGAWLSAMAMEQKLDLRAAHIQCFSIFLTSMGCACVRWSERIINVFEEYSVYHKEQEHCFKAMHVFMRETWKRTHKHFPQLIVILLKALHDLNDENSCANNENYENRISSIVQCLNLLRKVTPDQMNKIASDLRADSRFSEIGKKYFTDTTSN
ncbi:TELO2-interacting protein 2 isoform X2 [Nilaparvata lugens]|nr:TELO2-interacting protein 2 isoform X2 [Nilaparvata lugens]